MYGEYIEPLHDQKIETDYYELVCLSFSLLGLFIRIFTVGYTPKNTSGRNTTEGQLANEFNTTGMYYDVLYT
ncbi:hypothetical protein [Zunongwangia sp.]|uniref:hypothetical protein n=1 Tax=Zunongwangia sp. TaxID=1965325 RepID=UPI003AA8AF7C